jgi:hypothetical protein
MLMDLELTQWTGIERWKVEHSLPAKNGKDEEPLRWTWGCFRVRQFKDMLFLELLDDLVDTRALRFADNPIDSDEYAAKDGARSEIYDARFTLVLDQVDETVR